MAMLIDRRYNPFRDFEDIDRSFFGDNSLAEFKTDIRDIGDAYVMECDLPGFRREKGQLPALRAQLWQLYSQL